jgi:hypothetical protein
MRQTYLRDEDSLREAAVPGGGTIFISDYSGAPILAIHINNLEQVIIPVPTLIHAIVKMQQAFTVKVAYDIDAQTLTLSRINKKFTYSQTTHLPIGKTLVHEENIHNFVYDTFRNCAESFINKAR